MIDKDNHYIPDAPELAHVGGNTVGGNPQTFYSELWAWLREVLPARTVLDVGCGEGHAVKEFSRLGFRSCGIDGAPRNAQIGLASDLATITFDLTRRPCIIADIRGPFKPDLVWCCEVVGQIDIQYIDNVCKTLSQGKYLAMTNQLPDQQGYHMVNCRPTEFWEALMIQYGMVVDRDLTEESKKYAGYYWAKTGRIYRKAQS